MYRLDILRRYHQSKFGTKNRIIFSDAFHPLFFLARERRTECTSKDKHLAENVE
jgi:hypothetical protein